jgi:hypothetical protein
LLFEREKAMIWANTTNDFSSGEFHRYLFGRWIFSRGLPKSSTSICLYDGESTSVERSIIMSHVFISYSRKDSETVDRIVQRLEAENFTVWIDQEEIHGGDLWREAIVEAVDHAYAFVLKLSPSSVALDNVRKEVDLADGAGKALLPLYFAQA